LAGAAACSRPFAATNQSISPSRRSLLPTQVLERRAADPEFLDERAHVEPLAREPALARLTSFEIDPSQ
jgi:hypothetical protein